MHAPRRPLLLAALLVACKTGPSAPPPEPAPEPVVAAPVAAPPAAVALPEGVPDTTAGRQLAWVFDVLTARGGVLDAAEAEAHFHPSFLAQVPAATVVGLFGQLGPQLAGATLSEVTEAGGGAGLVARLAMPAGRLKISLRVDADAHTITGLLLKPDEDEGPRPTSIDEAKSMLAQLAPRAQLLVAEVERGRCKPIHAVSAGEPLAIGSTFKLYVLLGVVDRILAGKLAWDSEIEVRDAWKSLPSGTTQDEPAGTKLTVKTLAERMISISDNTATDHLLYTLGRKQVEAAVRASKHAKPALNVPFLATRELFLLKLGLDAPAVDGYLTLKPEKRRAYLDGELATQQPTITGVLEWTEPRRIDTLEWFASAEDLCRVMATLQHRAEQVPAQPLLEVLGKSPGIPLDSKTWPYVGFKGGSEPGVMNLTWLLRRDDARWFVVSLGLNAPAGPALQEGKTIGLAAGLIDLVAREGRPAN